MESSKEHRGMIYGALVLLFSAGLFISTWSPALQVAGSRDVVAAACNLAPAPPPGYPLYMLLGHGFCALPWSTPAGRLGILSLLCGIWTVFMLYQTVLRLTGRPWAAAVAALTLAAGEFFWRHSSMAGVHTLNTALCITVAHGVVRAGQASTARGRAAWLFKAGIFASLALCNHHSSVLLLPLVLVAALARGSAASRRMLGWPGLLAGLALGALPYVWLMHAGTAGAWGDTSTSSGLWQYVLQRDYGVFSMGGAGGDPLSNLGRFLAALPRQIGWVLWPLALLGMVVLGCRSADRPLGQVLQQRLDRAPALMLGLLPLITGPLYLMLFDVTATAPGGGAVERYYLLPGAFLCLSLGVGLAFVDSASNAPGGLLGKRWQGLAWVVVGLSAVGAYAKADVSQRFLVEDYARNCLAAVERGGMIIGDGRSREYGIPYVQQLLPMRPDVLFVDASLLGRPSYMQHLGRARPGLYGEQGRTDLLRLIQRQMRLSVPVYMASLEGSRARAAFGGYPAGPLERLLPPGVSPPHPKAQEKLNRRLFRGFSRRGQIPDLSEDPLAAFILTPYARTWDRVARMLYLAGDRRGALRALARGQEWAPGSPVPDWFAPRARRR